MNKTSQVRSTDLLKLANPDGRYRVLRSEDHSGFHRSAASSILSADC